MGKGPRTRRSADKLHVSMRVLKDEKGKPTLKAHTPADAITIDSKADLMASLRYFANPNIYQVVPDSKNARKNFVEKIRPALRYYCKKYNVDIPKWLADDSYYLDRMSTSEKIKAFGTTQVKPMRFTKLKTSGLGGHRKKGTSRAKR